MNSGAQSVVVVDAMRSVASTLIEHGCRLGLASLLLFLVDVRTLDKEGRTHVCIFTFIALPWLCGRFLFCAGKILAVPASWQALRILDLSDNLLEGEPQDGAEIRGDILTRPCPILGCVANEKII